MKIFTPVLIILAFCQLSFGQQYQFNYYHKFPTGGQNSYVNKILDFQNKKLLVFSNEIASLDTVTGIVSPMPLPININYIVDADVDSAGKLYLLAQHGLYDFDGSHWNYHNYNSSIFFNAMVIEPNGNVDCFAFFNSANNIYRWSGSNWSIIHFSQATGNETIVRALPGPFHDCRFISSDGNVGKVQGSATILFDQIPTNTYYEQYDESGRLWYALGSNNNNVVHDTTGFDFHFNSANTPFGSLITPHLVIKPDSFEAWTLFYSNTYYLYHMAQGSWQNEFIFPFSFYFNSQSIFYENNNEVWVQGGDSLYRFKNNQLYKKYSLYYDLSFFHPTDIYTLSGFNNFPQAWLGTENGLYRFTGYDNWEQNFNYFDSAALNISTNKIFAIQGLSELQQFGQNDTVYVGTDKGVFVFKASFDSIALINHFTTSNSLIPSDTVTAIALSDSIFSYNEKIWFGTNKGFAILSSSGWEVYDTSNSILPSNHINRVNTNMETGSVFICTDSGLVQIRNGVWKLFTTNNSGLNHSDIRWVTDFQINSTTQQLYVATMGGGLNVGSTDTTGQWQHFSQSLGNFPSDSINYLYSGNSNNWSNQYTHSIIGTKDVGLLFYGNGDFFNAGFQVVNSFNQTAVNNFYDFDLPAVPCQEGGFYFISICDSGFILDNVCWGGIDDMNKPSDDLKAWFDGDNLSVTWDQFKIGKAKIELFDIQGRLITENSITVTPEQINRLTISNLASGIYIVKAIQNENAKAVLVPVLK